MTFEELDLNGTYTYADYLKWNFDERIELIKGKIFKMSPAPARKHQESHRLVFRKLDRFFEKAFVAFTLPHLMFVLLLAKKTSVTKFIR